jgi:hypothetical protein
VPLLKKHAVKASNTLYLRTTKLFEDLKVWLKEMDDI